MDKGVLEIDAKEVRITKKSKKKIKQMDSFSFLTETPFSKLKWRSFDVWMPSVLYKGWNYKVMHEQSRKKGADYITNSSTTKA